MNEDVFPIENGGSFQPVMLAFRGLTVNPKGYFAGILFGGAFLMH